MRTLAEANADFERLYKATFTAWETGLYNLPRGDFVVESAGEMVCEVSAAKHAAFCVAGFVNDDAAAVKGIDHVRRYYSDSYVSTMRRLQAALEADRG